MKTDNFKELIKVISRIETTDSEGKTISLAKAINKIIDLIAKLKNKNSKIMIIGNGGSATIASHIVTDFLKNAKIPAIAFNDASLITCLSNDLGYEYVFAKPIGILAKEGDILFSISSSGKSQNILRAVSIAKQKGCFVITLSGFSKNNPLKKTGDINFYTPSYSYGDVEIAHLAICHNIVDRVIKQK